jgi:hypothetical protein
MAAGRPIFVRRLPVFEELWEALGRTPNIRFYDTTADLVAKLKVIPAWEKPEQPPVPDNGIARCARDIFAGIEAALAKADYATVVGRLRAVKLVNELSADLGAPSITPSPNSTTEADKAAYYLAVRVERLARRLFRRPLFFRVSRLTFRVAVRPLLSLRRRLRRRR